LDILKITKQSLNRVLKELVDTGFIEQRPGVSDRRRRLLYPTESGAISRPASPGCRPAGSPARWRAMTGGRGRRSALPARDDRPRRAGAGVRPAGRVGRDAGAGVTLPRRERTGRGCAAYPRGG
jgi:hypothetical protein